MKNKAFVVLPNQLFQDLTQIKKSKPKIIVLYEHPVYFTLYKFHKLKLIFHRASMKKYYEYLKNRFPKILTLYIEFQDKLADHIPKKTFEIVMYDPEDHAVKNFNQYKHEFIPSPMFLLNTASELLNAADNCRKKSSYSHSKFYKYMRRKFDILIDSDGNPTGGKWSFDSENRDKFPNSEELPDNSPPNHRSKFVSEACWYVDSRFKNNVGSSDDASSIIPSISHSQAKKYFQKFLTDYFECFGKYQDAVSSSTVYGCHSNISALINSGLLTPRWVIAQTQKFINSANVNYPSAEGFLRQIIGWREYCHMMYNVEFAKFNAIHENTQGKPLPKSWYSDFRDLGDLGEFQISQIPIIDDLIRKAIKYSYLHHIERLMYIGNFMTLTEVSPRAAHNWFITVVSLDAYHWVMYPNVFGMAIQSPKTRNLMMNREYFSSSNYLIKMSDVDRGEWEQTWDALYYRYIWKHRKRLRKNYATAAQVKHWESKSPSEQAKLLNQAKKYLKRF